MADNTKVALNLVFLNEPTGYHSHAARLMPTSAVDYITRQFGSAHCTCGACCRPNVSNDGFARYLRHYSALGPLAHVIAFYFIPDNYGLAEHLMDCNALRLLIPICRLGVSVNLVCVYPSDAVYTFDTNSVIEVFKRKRCVRLSDLTVMRVNDNMAWYVKGWYEEYCRQNNKPKVYSIADKGDATLLLAAEYLGII